MITAFETGAVFVLEDRFSRVLERLFKGLESADRATVALQDKLSTLTLGPAVARLDGQLQSLTKLAAGSTDKMLGEFDRLGVGANSVFDKIKVGSDGLWAGFADGAKIAADSSIAQVERLDAAMQASLARMKSLTAAMGVGGAGVGGGGRGHVRPGGIHARAPGMHVPGGGHVGMSGDGTVPLIAGLGLLDLMKHGVDHALDMEHWSASYKAAGFSDAQISAAKRAAWANAGSNPNASAVDSFKNILELNKATGNLDESMKLLPMFSMAETAMQSIKAEGLHSKFNSSGQTLNFAKGLEELGVTQMGEEKIKEYVRELTRTMVSSRGLFDGNALFNMTNNSGGMAASWDMRMATTVAPIIGDIMKHSKLGNADYMITKSYAGGHITSDAVQQLMKYGLTAQDDTFQDPKGNWHLKANSQFAKGITSNVWDWSGGVIGKLQAHGVDTSDDKQMDEVMNALGPNKSTTMLLRALLMPNYRGMIGKEMALRDKVPGDAAGVLQQNDPTLKIAALGNKLNDFFTALGSPLIDPAIAALTKLTSGLTSISQFMEAHPTITEAGTTLTAIAGGLLTLAGAMKMFGFLGGGGGAAAGVAGPGGPGIMSFALPGFVYGEGKNLIDKLVPTSPDQDKVLNESPMDRLKSIFHRSSFDGVIGGSMGDSETIYTGVLAALITYGGGNGSGSGGGGAFGGAGGGVGAVAHAIRGGHAFKASLGRALGGGGSYTGDGSWMSAIIRAEGTGAHGNPYDTSLGYLTPSGKSLSQMTMGEALAWGDHIRLATAIGRRTNSSAKGAFQIVNTTQRLAMAALGYGPNTPFDKPHQDAMANWIRQKQGFGAWEGFKTHPHELQNARKALTVPPLPTQSHGGEQAMGDVYLDGQKVGRHLARHMSAALARHHEHPRSSPYHDGTRGYSTPDQHMVTV